MATITSLKLGGTTGLSPKGETFVYELNVADIVAAGGVTGDTVVALTIPAYTHVSFLSAYNQTEIAAGTLDIDIGDSAAATTYVSSATTKTAGTIHTVALASKTYITADTLQIKITSDTLSTGILVVAVRLTNVNPLNKAECPTL